MKRTAVIAIAGLLLAGAATSCTSSSDTSAPASTTEPAAAAPAEVDLAADPGALASVPDELRPVFRWWWPSDDLDPDEIKAELQAMKDAGFGAVEQVMLRNNKDWGSERYAELIDVAATEAARLGLRFDITLGPSWPMSSPATEDLSKELSSQSLHYGAADLTGPTTFDGPVPDAETGEADQPRRLIAAVAYPVLAGGVLDPTEAIDLTDQVDDGNLTWDAPAGTWRLFGFWMRPSLMRSKPIGGGEPGWYAVDHLSTKAVEAVLADYDDMLFDDDLVAALKEHDADLFEDSYEVELGQTAEGQTAVLWTPDMLAEFADARGYEATTLLAGLFTENEFPDDGQLRLQRDFQETITDLTIANHIEPITEWAHAKGLNSRSQPYQAGLGALGTTDNNRLAAAADHADVETLGFGDPTFGGHQPVTPGSADGRAVLDRYRQVVSGSHLSGNDEITNEWGAVMSGQFQVDPDELLAIANRSLSAGVTRMALHGFAYRDYEPPELADTPRPIWPGWCAWCGRGLEFADAWNQTWPQLKALPVLNDYLARSTAVLESGKPRIDLAVIDDTSVVRGIGAPSTEGTPQDATAEALHSGGFTWDEIDPESIDDLGDVTDGQLLPDGPGYRALVIDDLTAIPAATIERVADLADDGLPVVLLGDQPKAGTGFADPAAEDANVQAATQRLLDLPNVTSAADAATLDGALSELEIAPDLQAEQATTIVPVHRRTETGDVWFLYNDSSETSTAELTFATPGAPTTIDLWTGAPTPVDRFARDGDTVTVPVTIPAGGTAVLAFDRSDEREPAGKATDPELPEPVTVTGPWTVEATTVQPDGDDTVELTLPELVDWQDVPELQGRSGTATLTASVTIPEDWLADGSAVLLDPGAFGGAIRAWVNDKPAAVPPVAGQAPTDVTALLQPGENTIRIELTTTLRNAMIAAGQTGDPNYAAYKDLAPEPTGLTGPVQLLPSNGS